MSGSASQAATMASKTTEQTSTSLCTPGYGCRMQERFLVSPATAGKLGMTTELHGNDGWVGVER